MRSLAARYPASGAWPGEMCADTTAAYFDLQTTGQLWKAIERGEAPRPSSTRLRNGKREPHVKEPLEAIPGRRHAAGA